MVVLLREELHNARTRIDGLQRINVEVQVVMARRGPVDTVRGRTLNSCLAQRIMRQKSWAEYERATDTLSTGWAL